MTTCIFARACALLLAAAALGACSSGPQAADWQLEAQSAMARSVAAHMEGNVRVEQAELARARSQLARTGRADLLANAELLHCATRVASAVFEPCAGFEPLRQDATPAQRAYADFLRGKASGLSPQDMALLPAPQRATAQGDAGAVKAMAEPLSQLVAAGVLLQTGRASPAVVAQAVDTASSQGWRRPLLAWLGVQASLAEQGGDTEEAARLRRRMALTDGVKAPGGSAPLAPLSPSSPPAPLQGKGLP